MPKERKIKFKQVKEAQQLPAKIVAQIKAMVAEGNLQPGDKLPPEREFAPILGISRTPLREALKVLAAMGLVKSIHGKGVFIEHQSNVSDLSSLTSLILPSDPEMISDIFQIRKVMEQLAVELAVQRCNVDEIEKLTLEVEDIRKSTNNSMFSLIKFYEHDYRFHVLLAKATHNALIESIMKTVMRHCAECRRRTLRKEYRPYSSIDEHLKIVEAISKRDLESARKAITEHINNVIDYVLNP
ncbi:MAG: FadR/GntR family transcriptional regulator [Desulfobaccales bacterium]